MYKLLLIALAFTANCIYAQSVDPTKPLDFNSQNSKTTLKKGRLMLQTIVDNGKSKSVVINGQLLTVGEKINQYKLSKISNNGVVLSSPEKTLTLTLFTSVAAESK